MEEIRRLVRETFQCPYCLKEFNTEKAARKHTREHQEMPLYLTKLEISRLREILGYADFHSDAFFVDAIGKSLSEKVFNL